MNFERLFLTSRAEALPLLPLHFNAAYADGWTLVHQCIREGDNDTLLKLIDCGANLDVEDSYGITTYDVAAQCGNTFAYHILFDKYRERILNRDMTFLIECLYVKSTPFRSFATFNDEEMSVDDCTKTILFSWLSAFHDPDTFLNFWDHLQSINYKLGPVGISNCRAGLHRALYGEAQSVLSAITKTAIRSKNLNIVRTIALTKNGVDMLRCEGLLSSTIASTSFDIAKYLFELGQPSFLKDLSFCVFPDIRDDIRILDLILAYSLYKPSAIGSNFLNYRIGNLYGKIPTLHISFLHHSIINCNYEMVERLVMVCDLSQLCNRCCFVTGNAYWSVSLGLCRSTEHDSRFFRLLMKAGAYSYSVYRYVYNNQSVMDTISSFYDNVTLFEIMLFQVQKQGYREYLKTCLPRSMYDS
jgi:hypothetical protein